MRGKQVITIIMTQGILLESVVTTIVTIIIIINMGYKSLPIPPASFDMPRCQGHRAIRQQHSRGFMQIICGRLGHCSTHIHSIISNSMRDGSTVSPLYLLVMHQQIQPNAESKYLGGNTPESSRRQNLSWLNAPNYFHSIYVVIDSIGNQEMI